MVNDLVFDIGLHNGDDSAYYLHLGYRVLGIEANPLLAAGCNARFSEQIRQRRMTVVNAGVLEQPGVFPFYRNLVDDGWSSFDPERGKKGKWEEMKIPCVTTHQLIAEHGKPLFMKVDIEGADFQVLKSLAPSDCPAYASLELNCTDPIIDKLIELGYTAFKFVDGETYWPAPPIFDHEIGWRLLRKAGRVLPLIRKAAGSLPPGFRAKSEWNPDGKYSADHYPFTRHNSGPFGEQAAGPWMAADPARKRFQALVTHYSRAERTLWWDVHARHGSARC